MGNRCRFPAADLEDYVDLLVEGGIDPELVKQIRPGARIRIEGYHPEVLHVRGLVDGNLVVKQWIKHKNRWSYEVESWHRLQIYWKEGRLKIQKGRK